MGLYLISMGLEKREFMGTGAWYYMLVNCFKVPFSASLGLITLESLRFNLMLTPVIVVGALLGVRLPERTALVAGLVLVVTGVAGAILAQTRQAARAS